jgi:hypothetical protein
MLFTDVFLLYLQGQSKSSLKSHKSPIAPKALLQEPNKAMAPKKTTPAGNDKKVVAKKKTLPPAKANHSPLSGLVLSPSSAVSSFNYGLSSLTADSSSSVISHSGVASLVSTAASHPSPVIVVSQLGVASLVDTPANCPSCPSAATVQCILSQSQIGAGLPKEGLSAFGIKLVILSG